MSCNIKTLVHTQSKFSKPDNVTGTPSCPSSHLNHDVKCMQHRLSRHVTNIMHHQPSSIANSFILCSTWSRVFRPWLARCRCRKPFAGRLQREVLHRLPLKTLPWPFQIRRGSAVGAVSLARTRINFGIGTINFGLIARRRANRRDGHTA